jgi:hypothetical protein
VPHALRAPAPVATAAALLIVLAAACGLRVPPNPVRLPDPPTSLPPGPFQHAALSSALAAGTAPADLPEAAQRARPYLATIAAAGPRSHPELFPAAEDVLAYLVNAHLAWSIALGGAPELAGIGTDLRRLIAFPLDGERWSLAALEGEIARRAPADPRLGLWLDTGTPGRPPRPPAALEGHAFGFLIDLQARRCGAAPGTWALDAGGRRLTVASWATRLSGLPDDEPRRTRRLLDVVPPTPALRQQILDVCGGALQRCRIAATQPSPPG